jgi:hypothetical protein
VKQAWTNALAAPEVVTGTAQSYLTTDRDPLTWEPAEASLTLPPEADMLVLAVVSLDASDIAPFPSNFADAVSLTISAPPQPSEP